jgi:hypothetical protein
MIYGLPDGGQVYNFQDRQVTAFCIITLAMKKILNYKPPNHKL